MNIIVKTSQETEISSIKLTIARDWTTKNMIEIFQAFESLYDNISRSLLLENFIEVSNERNLTPDISELNELFRHQLLDGNKEKKGFRIKSLKYNSPGWIELLGHGVIISARIAY